MTGLAKHYTASTACTYTSKPALFCHCLSNISHSERLRRAAAAVLWIGKLQWWIFFPSRPDKTSTVSIPPFARVQYKSFDVSSAAAFSLSPVVNITSYPRLSVPSCRKPLQTSVITLNKPQLMRLDTVGWWVAPQPHRKRICCYVGFLRVQKRAFLGRLETKLPLRVSVGLVGDKVCKTMDGRQNESSLW